MHVLIADDDSISRRVLFSALSKLGHEVDAARHGLEAWESYAAQPPKVLISDWMMPGLDGLELTRRIRAERRAQYTYIILLTSLSGKQSYHEGMRAGADDFITKPLDLELLQARLQVAERILGLHAEVNTLQALLPICAYCRKIRDGEATWLPLEEYLTKRTATALSHGICASCYESEVSPQLAELHATAR